ncbi:hypothetical protein [Nocardioides sp. MH1]|uniref:hypothetical protein n=1 Tax=Nocardioides sp. MH1 TaxID=3242490 RepID=UPI0035216C17
MSTRRLYRRRFLNRPGHHAGAYAIAEVKVYAGRGQREGYVSASLAIADCSRVVDLDFYAGDESSAANALFKARRLREIVVDFTEAYEQAVADLRAERRGAAERSDGRAEDG